MPGFLYKLEGYKRTSETIIIVQQDDVKRKSTIVGKILRIRQEALGNIGIVFEGLPRYLFTRHIISCDVVTAGLTKSICISLPRPDLEQLKQLQLNGSLLKFTILVREDREITIGKILSIQEMSQGIFVILKNISSEEDIFEFFLHEVIDCSVLE